VASGFGYFVVVPNTFYPIWWPFHNDLSPFRLIFSATTRFTHLRKQFWGRHLWARGYLAVSSGTITDEMIEAYIAEQEGEPIQDDSRFVIDEDMKLPPSRR
jgi:putative transposase